MGSSYSICNSHLVFGPEDQYNNNTRTVVTNDGQVRVYQRSRSNSTSEVKKSTKMFGLKKKKKDSIKDTNKTTIKDILKNRRRNSLPPPIILAQPI